MTTTTRSTRATILALVFGMAACSGGGGTGGTTSTPPASTPPPTTLPPTKVVGDGPFIVVDQFGYLSSQQKIAVLRDPISGYDSDDAYTPGATIQVINTIDSTIAFTGAATRWNNGETDTSSGDRAWLFDFTTVTAPGT